MSRFMKLLVCAAVISFFSAIAHADISAIAITGQAAPGLPDLTLSSLATPSVNNSGQIAFDAGLSNGGTAIFRLSQGQLSLVVAGGQPIPDSTGFFFGVVGGGIINDSGTIAFKASISGGASNLSGIFVASGTSINKVLDTTTPIPGSGNHTVSSFGSLQLNKTGTIAAYADLTGSAGSCILVFSGGVISSVIQNAVDSFSLNNLGDIAYTGVNGGIYLFSSGTTQLIVQSGQSVPNSNLTLGSFEFPALNDQGDLVFANGTARWLFSPPFVPNAIIKWRGGVLEKIVAEGDPSPISGIGSVVTLKQGFEGPLIDNSGRVFFTAQIVFMNQRYNPGSMGAMFLFDNGNLSILANAGQVVQGVGTFYSFGGLSINNSGVVTFVSRLDTPTGRVGSFQLGVVSNFSNQVFFPAVADGAYPSQWSWRTTLILSNPDESFPASLTVSFYNDDGTPMNVGIQGAENNQFSFTIPASGSLQVETDGSGNVKTGWARVQSDKNLSGISIFSFYDAAGNYVSEVGAPAIAAVTSFSMFVESKPDINTGIAISNPNSAPVQVTLTLRDSQGSTVDSPVTLTVPPDGHIQKYITELFSQGILPSDFQGELNVMSPAPVIGMNLRQRQQVYTWLPLTP